MTYKIITRTTENNGKDWNETGKTVSDFNRAGELYMTEMNEAFKKHTKFNSINTKVITCMIVRDIEGQEDVIQEFTFKQDIFSN